MKVGTKVKFDYYYGNGYATVYGVVKEIKDCLANVDFRLWGEYDEEPKWYNTVIEISKLIEFDWKICND